MARWPAPARCKSRLAQSIGTRRAAAVQQRLQAHALAVLQLVQAQQGCTVRLALAGVGHRGGARLLGSASVELVLQGGGSLGLRMQRQFALAFRQGYRQVVLIGSDLPELAASDIQAAFAGLEHAPAVLAPAHDGGYWLVGLAQPAPRLFAGIDWGTSRVMAQSCQRAEQLGLALRRLHGQADLDLGRDLERWR